VSDFEVRPYRAGDEDSINRGFNETFGLRRPIEEWRWKFQPEQGGAWIIVAVDPAGEVAAQFTALRVPVQVDGRVLAAGHSVDAFSLPQPGPRQQRLYLKTGREFYRRYGGPEVAFLFGFPGQRHLRLGRLSLSFTEPMLVPVWRRPATRRRVWWPRYRAEPRADGAAIDELWRRAAHRYPVSPVRDAAWVRRRYDTRPGHGYRHLTLWRRDRIHAWAVVDTAGDLGRVIDLVWDGEDPRALLALDDAAARVTASAGARRLELWLAGDAAAGGVLGAAGWERGHHPERVHMTSVPFAPGLDRADLVARFYLTMGDSDLV
jgi:hypothetical protein